MVSQNVDVLPKRARSLPGGRDDKKRELLSEVETDRSQKFLFGCHFEKRSDEKSPADNRAVKKRLRNQSIRSIQ